MRLRWAVLLIGLATPARAQQPVWVFLRPEAVTGDVVTGVRARDTLANDRAIPRSLLEKISATGARVRFTSRWLQAVSVSGDANALARLRRMSEVARLARVGVFAAERMPPPLRAFAPSRARAFAAFDSAFYGPNWWAIQMLGIPTSHAHGFTGQGVRIAILDTGFEPAHEALSTRTLAAQRDFIYGDNVVSDQPGDSATAQEQHGTWVWSVLGGYKPGMIVGPAFDATFSLAKVDYNDPGDDRAIDEDRWVAAVEWADSQGARIISSSLAYRDFVDKPNYPVASLNGDVSLATRMADEAARRGILIVNAMGNTGPDPSSLWAPADADSIIAAGAVDPNGNVAVFSSRGPTGDGRIKPELAAPGVNIVAASSAGTTSYSPGLAGTSFATPYLSGLAAMFMQAWPNLNIMAVRHALLLSASRADSPDNNIGYGVPNITSAILFPEGIVTVGISGLTAQGELTSLQPTFTWRAPLINTALGPVRYRLEIARDTGFTTLLYNDTITDVFSLTLKQPLRPQTGLYWHVVAQAAPNITRRTAAAGQFAMPHWVTLLTLNDPSNEFTDSVQPTLTWSALAAPPPSGPLTFDVQILSAQTGAVLQVITGVTGTALQPTEPLITSLSYRWRVIARSPLGLADTVTSGPFSVRATTHPLATRLYQNFPNPFPRADLGATTTRVWFDVQTRSAVELAIYDLRGRLVRRLVPANGSCGVVTLDAGEYGRAPTGADPCVQTVWDGRDADGDVVPRGVYLLRLRAGGREEVKKIVFVP